MERKDIPTQFSIPSFIGHLNGESSLMLLHRQANLKYEYEIDQKVSTIVMRKAAE